MKKSFLAIAVLALVSAQAMADAPKKMDKGLMTTTSNLSTQTGTVTLLSEPTSSRDAAYKKGHAIIKSLHGKTPIELRKILKVSSFNSDIKSVMVQDKEVTVKEFSKQPNVIEYQALVNVKYHYRVYNSNN